MTNAASTRIVFMGSPEFAAPSLRALVDAGYNVATVVTQPDRPAGRGGRVQAPPVKAVARELGLPVIQPATLKDTNAQAELAALAPDLFVVAAYGQILPRVVLAVPPRGAINVHASLLPRWRGASPITAAILAGDPETGVSIMQLVPKMDAGPVIARTAVPIAATDTTGGLEAKLSQLGAAILVETLPQWLRGELTAQSQDESLVTMCSLVKKGDGRLRASMRPAEAERAVRAYNPWPGASVGYRGARLAIWRAHTASATDIEPGNLLVHEGLPAIALDEGLLVLDEVQRSGSRRVSGRDFLNGERGALPSKVELV